MLLPNKVYDVLKWVAQYLLPGLAALYAGLAQVWSLPYVEQIVGTIVALDTLLGLMLGIANSAYKTAMKTAITYEPVDNAIEEKVVEDRGPGVYILMSSETYNTLIWIAQVGLPGIGTFLFALTGLWGIPYGAQIVGTIAAIDTALGIILGVSTAQYKADLANSRRYS